MSSPKPNATPAEMAELYKLNQRLYGTKPEIVPRNPPPRQEPTRPTRPTPRPEPKRPMPPMPRRPDPLPQPVRPLPPVEPRRPMPPPAAESPVRTQPGPGRQSPVITQKPALRPTGKPSNQMEYKKGGSVPSASKRADGIAQRGKTRGKMC